MLHNTKLTSHDAKQNPSLALVKSKPSSFKPPHLHSSSTALRCIEELMRLTHDHPELMKDIVYLGGAASLVLMAAPWLLPAFGVNLTRGAALASSVLGSTGGALSLASGYAQHNILGFPFKENITYKKSTYTYREASASIVIDDNQFPLVSIKSNNHYDAGYVEGYILGKAIETSLISLLSVYDKISLALGLPKKDEVNTLKKYLADVLATIPDNYQEEMQGKVAGYNQWRIENNPSASPLSFELYLLMQLQPDIHNYNPLPIHVLGMNFACTTIAFRLGDYTLFTRVLDWPSFGIADHFIQIERKIKGSKSTIDIGFPLTTGLLTAVNENGLLVEINVAFGDKVKKPQGMPALFFNRYCAEHAATVADIHHILDTKEPLSAYHLTATDGSTTSSFHFFQSTDYKGAHVIEALDSNKLAPAHLIVANPSIKVVDDKAHPYNYKDSAERLANAKAFFAQTHLQTYIAKQDKQKPLSAADVLQLEDVALQAARLALINNCGSTMCAVYVYYKDKLIDARAVVDNNFAPDKPLAAYKKLAY
jgi:hypothetical protein